jgi:hypothetical protein
MPNTLFSFNIHVFSVLKSNEETFVLNGQESDGKPMRIDIGGTTLLYTQERSGRNLVKKLTGQGPTKHSIQIYVRLGINGNIWQT